MAIFGDMWIVSTVGLLLLGSISGQHALTAVGVVVFIAGGVARLWSRWALERIDFHRELSEHRAFLGESVTMSLGVANRKLLPLHWILLRQEVPMDVQVVGAALEASPSPGRLYVSRATSMSWYERVNWKYTINCNERGYFKIGPARLRSSDLFGFFPVERDENDVEYLLVYPRMVELTEPDLPFKRPFGDVRSRERLFEDPSRVMGLRDYRPEDPMKYIDWKATARRGDLQVRQFEPTMTLHLVMVVNINTLEHSWEGYIPELFEGVVTTAASIARHGTDARWAVGLYANGSYPQSDLPIRILPGRDPRQLPRLLEALAVIQPMATSAIEDVLMTERHSFPLGATIALVTALVTDEMWDAIAMLREDGHLIAIVWLGDDLPETSVPGVTIHRASDFLQL